MNIVHKPRDDRLSHPFRIATRKTAAATSTRSCNCCYVTHLSKEIINYAEILARYILLVSLKVGADFQQDSLAKWTTFILCNLLLWLLYVMFQSVLLDLFPQKKDKQSMAIPQTKEQEVQTDVAHETERTKDDYHFHIK